jgi:hypothetical protein
LNWLPVLLGFDETGWRYLLMGDFSCWPAGSAFAEPRHRKTVALLFVAMALAMLA